MRQQIVRFGGKSNEQLRRPLGRKRGQNIRGPFQIERGFNLPLLFELLRGRAFGAKIRHRRRHDDDSGPTETRAECLGHFFSRLDRDDLDAARRRNGCRACDEHHPGSPRLRSLGDGISHFSR